MQWHHVTLLVVAGFLSLTGCTTDDKDSPTSATGNRGALSLRLSIDPGSPFKSIAKSGTLTISASDMPTMTAPLTIGDSTVSAEVTGIPTGRGRVIALKVFAGDGTLGYQGSGVADIFPDSTTRVAINLVRSTGSADIVGGILEDTSSTAWPAPVLLRLGAQGSAAYGSVLDVDSARVWMAAMAYANQGGIDLVFQYYGSEFHLDNAVAAREAGIAYTINMTLSYDVALIKNVRLVKLSSRPADQESAKRLFEQGIKLRGSVISEGALFLVESTGGKLALLTVVNLEGTNSLGTVDIRLEALTIP